MNALIVGCQRCATSYLARILDQHPDIYMAKPFWPEPKFFLSPEKYRQGPAYYHELYFASRTELVLGEKSTSYMEYDEVAQRIYTFFPEARIIIMLRNPVERTISNYFFSFQNRLEKRGIEEALFSRHVPGEVPQTSVSPFRYIERSMYSESVERYLSRFAHVKVLIAELTVGSLSAIGDVYRYLDVDPAFVPQHVDEKVNACTDENAVPKDLRPKLAARFQSEIRKLEKMLAVDLDVWRS